MIEIMLPLASFLVKKTRKMQKLNSSKPTTTMVVFDDAKWN